MQKRIPVYECVYMCKELCLLCLPNWADEASKIYEIINSLKQASLYA